jgi:hypothetical protein
MLKPLIEELKQLWEESKRMTMTGSKNSTFVLRICGWSMILRPAIFFQEGAVMEFYHVRYVVLGGPPTHSSSPEIADMLDKLVIGEYGDKFVGYGKEHN